MKKLLLLIAVVSGILTAGCSENTAADGRVEDGASVSEGAAASDSGNGLMLPEGGIESIRTPEDIMARNSAIVNNAVILPEEAVRQHVSTDPSRVEEVLRQVKQTSDMICAGIDSDYSKLYAISQWVSENFYYDYDAANSEVTDETVSLDHILETKRTVCIGFANLTAALCCAQGMDCRVVHGTAAPSNSDFIATEGKGSVHEWTVVMMDGREVWVDALWNTSNNYFKGEYRTQQQHTRYFDMPALQIAKNHRADRCEIRDYFPLLSE